MKPNRLCTPHDRFFKESMEHVDIAQGVSQLLLPELLTVKIDYSTLRIEKDSWINSLLIQHSADVLYRAQTEVSGQHLLLLFEHKSFIDNTIGLQNYRNTSEIIEEEQLQSRSSTLKLPPVIPIVIYHGNVPWNVDNSIRTMFEIIEGTEQYIPQQGSVVIDLTILPDESIIGIAEVRAFILTLKYSRSPLLLEKLPQIISFFNGTGAVRLQYLEVIIRYLKYTVSKEDLAEFSKIVERELELGDEEMKKSSNIWAELGYIAGEEDGFKKGEDIGFKKGERKGTDIGFKDGEKKGEDIGFEKGIKFEQQIEEEKKRDTILKMLRKGISVEDISEFSGLTVKKISMLKKKLE